MFLSHIVTVKSVIFLVVYFNPSHLIVNHLYTHHSCNKNFRGNRAQIQGYSFGKHGISNPPGQGTTSAIGSPCPISAERIGETTYNQLSPRPILCNLPVERLWVPHWVSIISSPLVSQPKPMCKLLNRMQR